MIKIATTALVAAAMLAASSESREITLIALKARPTGARWRCVNLASLNLTPEQKTKIETWQVECMKAGCTKESRQTFLGRAKEILSPEQFAQLKAQCKKSANAKKTEA